MVRYIIIPLDLVSHLSTAAGTTSINSRKPSGYRNGLLKSTELEDFIKVRLQIINGSYKMDCD